GRAVRGLEVGPGQPQLHRPVRDAALRGGRLDGRARQERRDGLLLLAPQLRAVSGHVQDAPGCPRGENRAGPAELRAPFYRPPGGSSSPRSQTPPKDRSSTFRILRSAGQGARQLGRGRSTSSTRAVRSSGVTARPPPAWCCLSAAPAGG